MAICVWLITPELLRVSDLKAFPEKFTVSVDFLSQVITEGVFLCLFNAEVILYSYGSDPVYCIMD